MRQEAEAWSWCLRQDGAVVKLLLIQGLQRRANVGITAENSLVYWRWASKTRVCQLVPWHFEILEGTYSGRKDG